MLMIWAPSFTMAGAGISGFSLTGEVKRTVNESPYIRALAVIRRRDVIPCGPMKIFLAIVFPLVASAPR